MEAKAQERRLDGVGLAVIANRFESIVRNMQNTLVRTGRSGMLNIAKRLLLLHDDRRRRAAGDGGEHPDPRDRGPGHPWRGA